MSGTRVRDRVGWRVALGVVAVAVAVAVMPGCSALQQRQDFLDRGGITVQMCSRPGLDQCEVIRPVETGGATVKMNVEEIPAEIGDDNLSSFFVDCGRPVGIFLYTHCNFRGQIAGFHCLPGQGLEVPTLGPLANETSALVFSDEQTDASAGTVLRHTPIDFSVAVPALHAGLDTAISSGGTPPPGGGGAPNCTAVPQCCSAGGGGGMSAGDPIEQTFPVATEVYWTEQINILGETAKEVGHAEACPARTDRRQLLAIAHFTSIDLHNWGPDYDVELYWYFEPNIDRFGVLRLTPVTFRVWVEGGIHHGRIERGFASTMGSAAGAIACSILSTVAATADATVTGGGAAVLTGNQRLTLTYADPLPCNALGRRGLACTDYRRVPPTIIVHKE